jgi:two-component system nitrogen regulation response regulator NtrX
MYKILIIDDDENVCISLKNILEDEGYETIVVHTAKDALHKLYNEAIDVALIDIWLPDKDGVSILERIKSDKIDVIPIMITGHGTIDIAVKCIQLGAYDFIEKPLSIERIITSIKNAIEKRKLIKENIALKQRIVEDYRIIGHSEAIQEIRKFISQVARTNARVFITGENGTGKELVARNIHEESLRRDKPFVAINCAAIPGELIESELFGYEKGAFTGAYTRKIGKFELANGGTLFLDEVCDMSLPLQAKLLRVLQEQKIQRIGGTKEIKVDVRIISATNKNVEKLVKEGEFREDLYYRLNVIPLYVPPLRERLEDIEDLAKYFLKRIAKENNLKEKEITDAAIEELKSYHWPGNIREFRNILERICIMVGKEVIDRDDVKRFLSPLKEREEEVLYDNLPLREAITRFEKRFIERALEKYNYNVSKTARALQIERTYLHKKIRQYNINIERRLVSSEH